jgi:hypothetical protein
MDTTNTEDLRTILGAVSSIDWLERRVATRLRWTLWGAFILLERHGSECTCSYCRGFDGTVGLALPACKARNSWRVVWWRRNGRLYDLRWTLPSWGSRSNGGDEPPRKRE